MARIEETKRYIPLIDEIKMHVFQWATEAEWKKLPPAVNVAITQLMNELRIHESLKAIGKSDDRVDDDEKRKKLDFIMIFKQKYLETIDMKFSDAITPVNQVNISRTIANIENEGGNYSDFIEWFFDDFCSIEANKKYMPPGINFVCSAFVVNKYLYVMKDELKVKKGKMNTMAVKNMLLGIALPMAERTKDKDFSQKILDFSNEKITSTKFFDLMKAFAAKLNDQQAIDECAKIDEQKQMRKSKQ